MSVVIRVVIRIPVMVLVMDPILHSEVMVVMAVVEAGMAAMAPVIKHNQPGSIGKVVSLSSFSLRCRNSPFCEGRDGATAKL